MHRAQSGRKPRPSGGIKLKNVLQVCLLLAICVWLLYQMKRSHDKKKELEEQYSNNSYKVHRSSSEISRFGRKDLPDTIVKDVRGEARSDEEEKDEIEEEASHDEQVGSTDQEINGQDPDNDKEKTEQKEQVAQSEGKKSIVEDHEHEDSSSHEARENSFKGDDASSEVLHLAQVVQEHEEGHESGEVSDATQKAERQEGSNDEHSAQEVEHEDGSHEARERSFKGDDVSSAVDHKAQKDSEFGSEGVRDLDDNIPVNAEKKDKEIELRDETTEDSEGNHNEDTNMKEQLDSFVESNSTIEASPEEKEHEVVLTKVHNNPSASNITTTEARNEIIEQLDQKNLSTIDIKKERQENFIDNTLDNQTSLFNNSSDFSKNQDNILMNATAESQVKLETQSNEKQVAESKIEVQQNDNSGIEQVSTEEKPSLETIIPGEKPLEIPNSSSEMARNDIVKEAPGEPSDSNNSLHNDAAGKETQSQNDSSSLSSIQNEVKSRDKETLKQPDDEFKIEVQQNDKSEKESTEQLEIIVPGEKPEENHNSFSAMTANDTVKEAMVEPSNSNNLMDNDAAGNETNSQNDSSSLTGIQNEVKIRDEEAAQ